MGIRLLKGLFVFAMVVALMGAAPVKSEAAQYCWTMAPFIDTLRVSVTQSAGPATMYEAHVRWKAGTSYQMVGAGTITNSLTSGKFDMGFRGNLNSALPGLFGGNPGCDFYGQLDQVTLSGFWNIRCTGNAVAPYAPFSNSGTLTYNAVCPGTAQEEASFGPTAGE